ncbi:MAG TPA: DUF3772 domain-containing protein, partial [Aliiroseovarius sp.]|nr:DUF3772 domain-containing protein [Aliiroseovarius sp.]
MSPLMRRAAAAAVLFVALVLGAASGWAQQSDAGTVREAQTEPAADPAVGPGVEATLAGAGEASDGGATGAAAVDYTAWDKVAKRAEQALEAGRASDQALQTLRDELVGWREVFTKARAENEVQIKTLETQIKTLGPEPADGESEPAAIAQTRALLNTQLEEAQAPVKAAELALARGNALIAQIDTTLRTRQTNALFALGPTPLNPAIWPKAVEDLFTTFRLAWSGVKSTFGSDAQRAEFWQNLPVALLFGVAALVLILRGRAWVMRAGRRLGQTRGGRAVAGGARGAGAWRFLLSLGQFALPLAGVYALVEALHHAGILGLRAQVIADGLPALGLSFFTARWLGSAVFAADGHHSWALLHHGPRARVEGRFHVATLGFLIGLNGLLTDIAAYETYSQTTRVVLGFPIILIAGISLFRIGQLLRADARMRSRDSEAGASFLVRTLGWIALALMLAGAAGPLAAAVGYTKLADSSVFPTVLTAGLVATLLGLHGFFVSLYGVLFKTSEANAREALLPVLASFVVALLMLPVLALIWGARVSDLTELWTRLGEGVQIGDTVIAPANLLTLAIVFAIGFGATRLVQGTLKSTVLPKTRLDIGGQNAITAGVG